MEIEIKVYKKALFFFILTTFSLFSAVSDNSLKVNLSLFKNINELIFKYDQKNNDKDEVSITKIYRSNYAEEEILISKTISNKSEITVYLKFNGDLIKTKILDKEENIRYIIEYNKKIRVVRITKKGIEEKIFNERGYDTSALALLLSVFQLKKEEALFLNIIDYKKFELEKIKIEMIDNDVEYKIGINKIKAIKYKVSSFLFYDSIFYYSYNPFPVLLYYEGPASINFLNRTEFKIQEDSYYNNKNFFLDSNK